MLNKITFGKCLNLLLTTLNIPMSHLAKAINVDNSLVNHWVHEKRIPSYGTSYIDNISEYLSKNITDTYQVKILDELYYDLNGNYNVLENNNREKILELLYCSLNYSMECKKKDKEAGNSTLKSKSQTEINVNRFDISQSNIVNSVDLSNNDKIIYNISNIFYYGISMLETAIRHKQSDNNVIYITCYNNLKNSYLSDNRIISIRNVLLKAIDHGWKIIFLLKIDSNIERAMGFIHFVLPIICTGKVYIYYLNKYDSFMTEKEMYIVSGIGALSCYPDEQNSAINCGFYLKSKEAIDVFTNYINKLIKENGHPLVKYYLQDMKEEYHRTYSETIEKTGNQFNYNSSFSMYFIPEGLYKKLIQQTNLSQQEKLLSLHYYQRQLKGVIANLQNHKCNTICFSDTLEILVKNHTLNLYTYSKVEMVNLETHDIIEYLQNMIYFIMAYDNFNIAVIFQDTNFEKNKIYKYMIKERRAVYLNAFGSLENTLDIRLSIEEPMVIKAFAEYFNIIWDKIAPINKDKNEIITWLQSYIKSFTK